MSNVIENRFLYHQVHTAQEALQDELFICGLVFEGPVKFSIDCEENHTMYFYKTNKTEEGYKLVFDNKWDYGESSEN